MWQAAKHWTSAILSSSMAATQSLAFCLYNSTNSVLLVADLRYSFGCVQVALYHIATLANGFRYLGLRVPCCCHGDNLLLLLCSQWFTTSTHTLWPAVMVALWYWCYWCACPCPLRGMM